MVLLLLSLEYGIDWANIGSHVGSRSAGIFPVLMALLAGGSKSGHKLQPL